MIVVSRFRVSECDAGEFRAAVAQAHAALAACPGYAGGTVGRNVDDPALWVLTTTWENVGSYRRALQGNESKMVVVPLLSRAIDEPTAYEDPDLLGENVGRGHDDGR